MAGLYGHRFLKESVVPQTEATDPDLQGIDLRPYVELMAYDDLSRDDAETIREFCASERAQVLQERQVLNKGTLMRLSKADDEKRRIKLIVYQMAKEANDPDWKKMILHRGKMKQYRAKLIKKYGNKAHKLARVAQRDYIRKARKNEDVSSAAKN